MVVTGLECWVTFGENTSTDVSTKTYKLHNLLAVVLLENPPI